jgi:hypothetical protein
MGYGIVLFQNISHALKGEKLLKTAGLTVKLIPVPKEISADCGVCLRFTHDQQETVIQILHNQVKIQAICSLKS